MKEFGWKGLSSGFLLIGTVIGAGFVSGKEICIFFGGGGRMFYVCAILCGVLFGLLTWLFMTIARRREEYDGAYYMRRAFGRFGRAFNIFLLFSYLVTVSGMLAAGAALSDRPTIVTLVSLALCLIVAYRGMDWLRGVNFLLVPVILIFLIIVSVYSLLHGENTAYQMVFVPKGAVKSITDTLLYVCMNCINACNLFVSSAKDLTKRNVGVCSVSFGGIIIVMILLVGSAVFAADNAIARSDLPVIYLARRMGPTFSALFQVAVWCGIFTTLLSSYYILTECLANVTRRKFLSAALVGAAGWALSLVGFSDIVSVFYPILGFIGAIFFVSFAVRELSAIKDEKPTGKEGGDTRASSAKGASGRPNIGTFGPHT